MGWWVRCHEMFTSWKEIDFVLNKNLKKLKEQNSRWLKTKNHRNALMLANFLWFARSAPTVNSLLLGATRSETVTSLESSNLEWGLFQMQFVMSNNMYQPHFLHAVGKNWLKHPETCPCPGSFPKHCRAKGAMFANHPANRTWLRSTRLHQLMRISAWMLKKLPYIAEFWCQQWCATLLRLRYDESGRTSKWLGKRGSTVGMPQQQNPMVRLPHVGVSYRVWKWDAHLPRSTSVFPHAKKHARWKFENTYTWRTKAIKKQKLRLTIAAGNLSISRRAPWFQTFAFTQGPQDKSFFHYDCRWVSICSWWKLRFWSALS